MNKTKKMNKIEKICDLVKLEKLVFNLMMNNTKMGKTLKSENFMISFPKIWTEERKLS